MTPCIATVGTFDGFHLGHAEIVMTMKSMACDSGVPTCVITFRQHPLTVVAPERAPLWAVPRDVSFSILREHVDRLVEMDFTPGLARMTAREFLGYLREKFNVGILVMGFNNTFGSDRLASRDQYVAAGRDAGVEIVFVGEKLVGQGINVSSSRLRRAIADGDLSLVQQMLGGTLYYTATVAEGRRLGRQMGFPTLNLSFDEDIVSLPDGVYAVEIYPEINGDVLLPGVLSVGANPTVSDGSVRTWEIHVPGVDLGNMYGKRVAFGVLDKIRDIRKFPSVEDLKGAIRKDIATAKKIFAQKSRTQLNSKL